MSRMYWKVCLYKYIEGKLIKKGWWEKIEKFESKKIQEMPIK